MKTKKKTETNVPHDLDAQLLWDPALAYRTMMTGLEQYLGDVVPCVDDDGRDLRAMLVMAWYDPTFRESQQFQLVDRESMIGPAHARRPTSTAL